MITFKQKGDFKKLEKYLENARDVINPEFLSKYGDRGVEALSLATPVGTGTTAASWFYQISKDHDTYKIEFHNSHVNDGANVAILLQYGHLTRNMGWVEGIDYINPALQPIFEQIAEDAWREVARL